jgi:hypothetical protein
MEQTVKHRIMNCRSKALVDTHRIDTKRMLSRNMQKSEMGEQDGTASPDA